MKTTTSTKVTAAGNECDRIWHDTHIKALASTGDWEGIVDFCCGSSHCDYTHLWALAMTAHYGPVGLHASRFYPREEGGRPDLSKCLDVPEVAERMDRAAAEIRRIMGVAT